VKEKPGNEDSPYNVMLYVGGDKRSWHCPGDGQYSCGCNVFTRCPPDADGNPRYQCNSCGTWWMGEK
jgi:hypothetical protein